MGSLENVTSKWDTSSNGTKDGLTVFSGDAFSPSVETSVTQSGIKLSRRSEVNLLRMITSDVSTIMNRQAHQYYGIFPSEHKGQEGPRSGT